MDCSCFRRACDRGTIVLQPEYAADVDRLAHGAVSPDIKGVGSNAVR